MGRGLRIVDPVGYYHFGSRGNNGERIFHDDDDRKVFLAMLDRVARRYRWSGLAWCLMSNHYHLVVHLRDGGLSQGMQELNCGYATRTNMRYGRTGHLFRNRFWDEVCDGEAHLLEACRYVVLNPVRAGICRTAGQWPWSSYRATAGSALGTSFLRTDELLRLFGDRPAAARREYRQFVAAGHVTVSDTGSKP
jgi:REP element-mobilizing transposase RayT